MNAGTSGPLTILIADDSSLMRRALRNVFETHPALHVVAEASTGREAVELTAKLRPRLVAMDIEMPDGDGLEAIETIMAETPTRIIVITGLPQYRGLDIPLEALSRGALEILPKPTAWPATDAEREHFVARVLELGTVSVVRHVRASVQARAKRRRQPRHAEYAGPADKGAEGAARPGRPIPELVVVGASTGGPAVLRLVLSQLPPDFDTPIVVVQHLAGLFAEGFVKWLQEDAVMRVVEAESGKRLERGVVHIAVRGPHVAVAGNGRILHSHEPPRAAHRPAIDVLFESAAESFGHRAVGMLLSGMGADGAAGMLRIAEAGGTTLGQDEATSAVFGMAKAALERGACQRLVAASDLATTLANVCRGRCRAPAVPGRRGGRR